MNPGRPRGVAQERKLVAIDFREVEIQPLPRHRAPAPPGQGEGQKGAGQEAPGAGGSGSSRIAAPIGGNDLLALPSRGGGEDLADLAPTAVAASSPNKLLVASNGGAGAQGKGRGPGAGDGTGGGKVPKRGSRYDELAKLAAAGKVLGASDYQVIHRETFYYMMGSNDHPGELDGQMVKVRLLVDANGRPLFAEALSGPSALCPRTLRAVRGWFFSLSPKAKAQAPVVIIVWFRFGLNTKPPNG